jgi:hypothetical protein
VRLKAMFPDFPQQACLSSLRAQRAEGSLFKVKGDKCSVEFNLDGSTLLTVPGRSRRERTEGGRG